LNVLIPETAYSENVIKMYEINGPYPGFDTELINKRIRFSTADAPIDVSCYMPCVIPANESPNYSMKKSIYLKIESWKKLSDLLEDPSINQIGIFASGSYPEVDVLISRDLYPREQYTQARGICGVTGNAPTIHTFSLSEFDIENPYPIVRRGSSDSATSDIAILQLVIYPNAHPGQFREMSINLVAST